MATAAARPSKDLGPDWRDRLRESLRRFARRTVGIVLVGLSIAGVAALASHSSTDPSFTTAAGGPPHNWMGPVGAYASDLAFLLLGIGSILLLPVIALAGLRMVRLAPARRVGRALFLSTIASLLIGVALSLTSASAVSGLPGGWGGAIALAAANGLSALVSLIPDTRFIEPVRIGILILFAAAGLVFAWFALGLSEDERAWLGGLFRRSSERKALPRRTEEKSGERTIIAAPPKPRPAVAVTEPASTPARKAGVRRVAQPGLALGDTDGLPEIRLV
jgi:S-DNA-T family DNA segregation ATPase FtsK/SpoIIIE